MGEILDLKDKISKFYKPTKLELRGFIISIIAIAFAISFKDWGRETFNPGIGLFNFFNAILIVALSFIVHDAGKRISGLYVGFRVEFKFWTLGSLFAVILAFVSNGSLWLIIPGSFMVHHLAGHRLGFFRYGINYFAIGMIALMGAISSIMLIILLKILYVFAPSALIQKAIMFNVIFVITNMLPIPAFDGGKIYFGSRMLYAFVMPAIVASMVMMMIDIPVVIALIISFLVGIALWITYYISFENKVWAGPK
ncbi:MAG TPA: hypothetical protein VI564_09150 [Candidatus Nanoarchaeia archaeon]|nr:hypothetical protein [Candidatus Nanoarchaeia archaeon]